MSAGFLVALALAVATLMAARLFGARLPLRSRATVLTFSEVSFVVVGSAVLAFHCVAMFFTSVAEHVPGAGAVIDDIRALGIASALWYAAPALLVLLGIRRLYRGGVVVAVVALLSVGVTMYDGGPLDRHLFALFVGVVALAATLISLVTLPSRSASRPG